MQEEITQKTLALCVEASKMTAQLLQQAMKKVLADMEKHKKNPQLRHGKQTLRQLMKHNTGVSNIDGIISNLSGTFDTVNTKVAEIAGEVGMTPSGWNGGIFNMIRSLSETVIVPIAGIILTFVMCYELIQLIVEKNNLSDDRFAKMSRRYEDEQKELAEKIKKLRSEIEKQSSRSMTTDMFIGLVRKYTRARKLTPRMLNELIEKIEVFNAEKIDGVWEQRLRIHYNCVGTIEIPTVLPLPIPEVSVNTRKGVVVNYAPCELAV